VLEGIFYLSHERLPLLLMDGWVGGAIQSPDSFLSIHKKYNDHLISLSRNANRMC